MRSTEGSGGRREGLPLLVIVGPTGVGKTEAGIRVARLLNGEVLSADSRQVYRHMDIGTAKPTRAQRAEAPHHLIDLVDPDEGYSAGRFSRDAVRVIAEVRARGRRPIVVGGCGLYVRALLEGFSPVPEVDGGVRERVRAEAARVGAEALHRRLREVDPSSAGRIRPSDRQRIVRALEVYEATGEPMSSWQARPREGGIGEGAVVVGLRMERTALYARIEKRVERMISEGLVEEVERLRGMGYRPEGSALGTFGYREVFAHLEGEMPLAEVVRAIQQETRRYAKRQMTWFRGEGRVRWVDALSPDVAGEIVKELEKDN